MDHRWHYEKLIERAKGRVLDGYVESHHIVPKCLGGGNGIGNLVQLTAEEHFVAHQLLYKMYPNSKGLAFAMIAMTGNPYGKRRNKVYGWIRRAVAIETSILSRKLWEKEEHRDKMRKSMESFWSNPEGSKAAREAIRKTHTGRIISEDARKAIAEAGRNRERRVFSEEAKANMAESRRKTWAERKERGEHLIIAAKTRDTRRANGTYEFSEEHKAAIGAAGLGRTPWNKGSQISEESRKKMSDSAKARRKK